MHPAQLGGGGLRGAWPKRGPAALRPPPPHPPGVPLHCRSQEFAGEGGGAGAGGGGGGGGEGRKGRWEGRGGGGGWRRDGATPNSALPCLCNLNRANSIPGVSPPVAPPPRSDAVGLEVACRHPPGSARCHPPPPLLPFPPALRPEAVPGGELWAGTALGTGEPRTCWERAAGGGEEMETHGRL